MTNEFDRISRFHDYTITLVGILGFAPFTNIL